jgi:two-component system NtrC family sensor kinase
MSSKDSSSSLVAEVRNPVAEAIEHKLQDYERWFHVLDRQIRVLERERQKLSAIVTHTDAGFLLVDKRLQVTWSNDVFSRVFAAEPNLAAVVGQTCCRVLCRREDVCDICPVTKSFKTGSVSHHEIHLEEDGSPRHIYATSIPITSTCGSPEEAMVMLQDISDLQVLRSSQEALKASETRFRSIFEKATAGMATVALDGSFMQVNPAFCCFLGYEERELLKLKVLDVTHPEDREASRQIYREVLSRQRSVLDVEKRYVRKDGATVWGRTSATWLVDEEGRPTYSVALVQNITERKRLEQELRHAEKMSAVGQLVAGVAHEINNPLAGVLGYAQLLLQSDVDERVRRGLETISHEAERCKRIVYNLQTFARKQKPQEEYVDINEILENTLELQAYQLNVDNILVVKNLDPELPGTLGDFHQLRQVFLNMIVNAHQAMSAQGNPGALRLRSQCRGREIEVEIEDEGPGVAVEYLDRIFDPFFSTKEVGHGTGLGLSICYGIIREHQGKITVRNAPRGGAIFSVRLPIRKPAGAHGGEEADKAKGESAKVRPSRILVIDDELVIIDILNQALRLDGHHVDTAINGATALKRIEGEQYDLIISDLKMPGMNGQVLYEKVREMDPALAERMTFSTGDVVSDGTRSFFERTGARCLQKPFEVETVRKFAHDALLAERR